jgi:beta-galactosidase GanA
MPAKARARFPWMRTSPYCGKFLRTAIPRIADHPALHSICLSNEPVFTEGTKSRFVRDKWHRWLAREHGTIQTLNARWGTQYPGFDSVPVPPAHFRATPIVYDFIRFNQEAFAAFHAWMAGIIRQLAPDVPVHAKIMMHAALMRHTAGPWSIAPERFAASGGFPARSGCALS